MMMAQQNEFGFSRDKMNGEFIQRVKDDNGKIIYALDMSKFSSPEFAASFVESLHTTDKIYPVSTIGTDKLFFIAGFTSVISEAEVKVLVEKLRAQSEGKAASPASKEKFDK